MTIATTQTTDFKAARKAMIDSQLRTSGVNDPWVLQRMMDIPRENYVPAGARDVAYMDRAVPLDNGAKLPSPVFHAMMLAEARPTLADNVLLVDCGAGYAEQLFAPLVGTITVISPEQAAGPSRKGKGATLLLIEGAVEAVPPSLIKRLADNARVVTGVFDRGVTRLAVGQKTGNEIALLPVAEVGMPKLTAFDTPAEFSF